MPWPDSIRYADAACAGDMSRTISHLPAGDASVAELLRARRRFSLLVQQVLIG